MPFTSEQNAFILMAHFRSGTQNEDGSWAYSLQSCMNQFSQAFPDIPVHYDAFVNYRHVIIRRFEARHCICKGKSPGRPTVLTENVVEDIEQRLQQSPHKPIRRLATETDVNMSQSTSNEPKHIVCFEEEAVLTEAPDSSTGYKNKPGKVILSVQLTNNKGCIEWHMKTTIMTSIIEVDEWSVVDNVQSPSMDDNIQEEMFIDSIKIKLEDVNDITHSLEQESSVTILCDYQEWCFKFKNDEILNKFICITLEKWNLLKKSIEEQEKDFEVLEDTFLKLDLPITDVIDAEQPCEQNAGSLEAHHSYKTESHLPVQVKYKREKPLSLSIWIESNDLTGRICEAPVKQIIFKGGVTTGMKKEVWKFLLNYHKWQHTLVKRLELKICYTKTYDVLKSMWNTEVNPGEDKKYLNEKSKAIMEDVMQTDRNLDYFAGNDNHNLKTMHDILMSYVIYKPDLGYVHGMNIMLSPLVYVLNDEVESFWCFVQFMDIIGSNFEVNQNHIQTQLSGIFTLISFLYPGFADYLKLKECEDMKFCFDWVWSWFRKQLSMENVLHFWEVLWTGLPCKNFLLLVCVSLLESQQNVFMENNYGRDKIHIQNMSRNIDIKSELNNAEVIYNKIIASNNIPDDIIKILDLPRKHSMSGSKAD